MSADIVQTPADDCQESSTQNNEIPALDRDEILRKRRERRAHKRQELRRIKLILKQQKVKVVSGKEFDRLKKLSEAYDGNATLKVDLVLETAKQAATSAPPRPGIIVKKGRRFVVHTKRFPARKVNKGKTREIPKTHFSKLKKQLLEFRKAKKARIPTEVVEKLDKLKIDTTKASSNVPNVVEKLNELNLDTEKKSPEAAVKSLPASVHSRKFRPYCDNTTSKEICELTEKFLKKIFTFQKRAYEKNAIKGAAHRRYVCGFHEVQRKVEINKAKLVIIAPDCEPTEFSGGFEDIINTLKSKCKERDIPYLFSIKRRGLAYSLFKKLPVSCIAILSYDGAQELFEQLMDTLTIEREKYATLF